MQGSMASPPGYDFNFRFSVGGPEVFYFSRAVQGWTEQSVGKGLFVLHLSHQCADGTAAAEAQVFMDLKKGLVVPCP